MYFDDVRVMPVIGLGTLAVLLAAAVWHDVRDYRIPNVVVYSGIALAVLMHTVFPAGGGFAAALPGGIGLVKALQGLGVGLAALLPFYLLGAAGAGDAKLMAMVGAFVGPVDTLAVVLATFIAGAAMAVVWLMSGSLSAQLPAHPTPSASDPALRRRWHAKLPYSVAIATGTAAWVAIKVLV